MMDSSPDGWLRQEVTEHLDDFGLIGLYELRWLLNGSKFELESAEVSDIAHRVARETLEDPEVELRSADWPTIEVTGEELPTAVLDDESSWNEGSDNSFVALVQVGA